MPICTIQLVSLKVPIPQFLTALHSSSITPLTIARVVRWIILPKSTSTSRLLAQNIHWDLLLTLPSTTPLPANLQHLIAHSWSVQAGVPSRLLENFKAKNTALLHPDKSKLPPLSGAPDRPQGPEPTSAQNLELSAELREWVRQFGGAQGAGAVSMLNLLAFKPGMKERYLKYGAEFARSVGSKKGGDAKIVGTVIHGGEGGGDGDGWDEVALAHYPSVWHFADMLVSEEYQEVNKKYRVGSLKDTFILCTTELGLETDGLWKKGGSKL